MDESQQELQPAVKTPLQHPEPAALLQPRGEIKLIETNSSPWLSKKKEEMLVEVLIHKDPSFEPGSSWI